MENKKIAYQSNAADFAPPLRASAKPLIFVFGRNRQLLNIWELKSNGTDSLNFRFSEGVG